jgi:hypothetical protein
MGRLSVGLVSVAAVVGLQGAIAVPPAAASASAPQVKPWLLPLSAMPEGWSVAPPAGGPAAKGAPPTSRLYRGS